MSEIFEARNLQNDLRDKNTLGIPNARKTSCRIATVTYVS